MPRKLQPPLLEPADATTSTTWWTSIASLARTTPRAVPTSSFLSRSITPSSNEERWQPVFDICREKLLTPVGLRSLSPDNPDFKPQYYGDLRNRDAAYHQGTVWAWLIGPYINCFLKLHPGKLAEARQLLDGLVAELNDDCIGSVSEIFDAEPPYTPRGCCAQAWSVAELLRCLVLTAE